MTPVTQVALATLAGAAGGLAAFGAGWFLLAGAAPPLLAWGVGGVAAAFVGSELGCRAAVRFTDESPAERSAPDPFPLAQSEAEQHPVGSPWRDSVRSVAAPLHGPRR